MTTFSLSKSGILKRATQVMIVLLFGAKLYAQANPWTELQRIRLAGSILPSHITDYAINDGVLVIGVAGENNGNGALYFYKKVGSTYQQKSRIAGAIGSRLGASVLIGNGFVFAGAPRYNSPNTSQLGYGKGAVYYYTEASEGLSGLLIINSQITGDTTGNFGISLALVDNNLYIGANNALGKGAIYKSTYKKQINYYEKPTTSDRFTINNSLYTKIGSKLITDGTNIYTLTKAGGQLNYIVRFNGSKFSSTNYTAIEGGDIDLNTTDMQEHSLNYDKNEIYFTDNTEKSFKAINSNTKFVKSSKFILGHGIINSKAFGTSNVAVMSIQNRGLFASFNLQENNNDTFSNQKISNRTGIPKVFRNSVFLAQDSFLYIYQRNKSLMVTNKGSDAFLYFNWYLDAGCSNIQNLPVYVQLLDETNNTEIYSEVIDSLSLLSVISGNFEYKVKPNFSSTYKLRILHYGLGTLLCESNVATGTTANFKQLLVNKSNETIDKINFQFINTSDYADKITVYRDGRNYKVLDIADTLDFTEKVNSEINNGQNYNYCFQLNNSAANDTSVRICYSAKTNAIQFTASDNLFSDKINLSWNNLPLNIHAVKILRDGKEIVKLQTPVTGYTDFNPVAGHRHTYTLQLFSDNNLLVFSQDSGSIKAKGMLSGYVFTSISNGKVGVANATIKAISTILGKTYTYLTNTDATGKYTIPEIYFFGKSSFIVSASKGIQKITSNNMNVTFSNEAFNNKLDFTSDWAAVQEKKFNFSISNFAVTNETALDGAKIGFDLSTSDSIFYQIFRNEILIYTGFSISNQSINYTDATGIPATGYRYKLRAYSLVKNKYFVQEFSAEFLYPEISPIDANQFIVVPNNTNGSVELSWSYTKPGVSGYILTRNSEIIAKTDATAVNFKDYLGDNGLTHTYGIVVFMKKSDGQLYQSKPTEKSNILFPALPVPAITGFQTALDSSARINLSMNNNFYYEKLILTRKYNLETDTVGYYIPNATDDMIMDIDGVHGRIYTYELRAIKGKSVSASHGIKTYKYPDFPYVTSVINSGAQKPGLASLLINSTADGNMHQLEISVDGTTVFIGDPTLKNYYVNLLGRTSSVLIKAVITKTVKNIKYASFGVQLTYNPASIGNTSLAPITNFKASDKQLGQVLLEWEYPNYVLPKFYIYRDGNLIDSAMHSQRNYLDLKVDDNLQHLYQVRAFVNNLGSHFASDYGSKINNQTLSGFIYNKTTKQAVANALIQINIANGSKNTMRTTISNKSGYFTLPNPTVFNSSSVITASIVSSEGFFAPQNQVITNFNENHLKINFEASNVPVQPSHINIATIQNFIGIANQIKNSVQLLWSLSNTNYTGVEVYRGMTKLTTILNLQVNAFEDFSGAPGFSYTYKVVPFWNVNGEQITGKPLIVSIDFPVLYPIENLVTSPQYDEIALRWSHPTGNFSYIQIIKNGELKGTVKAGEKMEWLDKNGTSGLRYNYQVIAIKVSGKDTYSSASVTTTSVFPLTTQAQNLVVKNTQTGSNNIYTYKVFISWHNPSKNLDSATILVNGKKEKTVKLNFGNNTTVCTSFIPGKTNTYSIVQKRKEVASKPFSVNFTNSAFSNPNFITLTSNSNTGLITGTGNFNIWENEGIDSIQLTAYRGTSVLENILVAVPRSDSSNNFFIEDFPRRPGILYKYGMRIISWRNGVRYLSGESIFGNTMIIPTIADPINIKNIDSTGYLVTLRWEHPRSDIDSFEIFNNNVSIGKVGGAIRQFSFVPSSECVLAKIVASKKFGTQTYSSSTNAVLQTTTGMKILIPCNGTSSQYGRGLKMQGNKAVILATNSSEVFFYELKPAGWVLKQKLNANFNRVGMHNNTVVLSNSSTRNVYVYDYDGEIWNLTQTIVAGVNIGDVSIYGDYIAISQPSLLSNGGGFVLYKKDVNGNWVWLTTYSNPTANEQAGLTNIAINDKVVVITNKTHNSNRGKLWAYTYNSAGTISLFFFPTGGGSNNFFASSIDLEGDTLLVGTPQNPLPPKIGSVTQYLFTTPSNFTLVRTIFSSNTDNSFTEFGFSVAKMNGAALIGAPSFNDGSGTTGGWAATSITSSTNTYVIKSGASTGYTQGTSVDAVGNMFLISSPNIGTGRVHYLERTSGNSPIPTADLATVNASDGQFSNKVFISWTHGISNSEIDHFDVFRDGIKIDQTSNTVASYNDNDAIPGKRHIYSIVIVYASGIDKTGIFKSDVGFVNPNGKIYGKVVSLDAGSAISGVTVAAKIELPEGSYTKTTTSDLKGEYSFDNLYYGESANVEVSVKMNGAVFKTDKESFEMSKSINSRQVPDFYEISSYNLIVNITENQCNCGIDSIPVTLVTHNAAGTQSTENKLTAKNGKIAFAITPRQSNIIKYVIKPANIKINAENDTIYYKFNLDSFTISNPSSMNKITNVNFENQITLPINITVGNSCGAIGANTYTVTLETEDGCFKKTVFTNSSGVLNNFKVPPVFVSAQFSNVLPATSNNAVIAEYFLLRPVKTDLKQVYLTHSKAAMNNTVAATAVDLTYHILPTVSIESGLNTMCNMPGKPYVVTQGQEYNVIVNITENFNGGNCKVADGYVVIKNTGAQEAETTIQLQKGKAIKYKFTGGEPAITYPYFKYIIIEYWNASNEFVSNTSFTVVVTGTAAIPGTDFIIENDQNELQWPLMILRDPAGDESYSYIEKGESNTLNLSVEKEIGGSFSYGMTKTSKVQTFGAVLGGVFNLDLTAGGSSEYAKEFEINTTTNQEITSVQTSFTPNSDNTDLLAGPDADVIVGSGTAIGYGVAENISINGNCQIFKKSVINIQPNGITTQWVYTVDFIKNLIRQYDSLITNAASGKIEIEGGSIADFVAKKANWESILQYHKRETTPMYRLCDVNNYNRLFPVDGNQNNQVVQYMNKAKEWAQNCFCGQTSVGSYNSQDSFIMVENIEWNNDLLTKFKKTRAMVERYLEAAQFVNQLNFNINDPATAKGLRAIEDGLKNWSADAESGLILSLAENSMAENTSFSGGTSIDKQTTVEQTYSNSFTSNFTLSSEISYSLVLGVGIETRLSTGFGVEIEQKGVQIDFENNDRIQNTIEFTLSKSTEKTQTQTSTAGYHLEDNDLGDQFSVTAIKGIEKNHSPYFITLGGRSTCPSEPGTIHRDALDITFERPDGTGYNPVQRDLDPNKPAEFTLKLSSMAPTTFYEHLWYRISPNTNVNLNGATITANGNNTATFDYLLTSGQSVYANIMVYRNSLYYNYPDLGLYLGRICTEGYDIYNGANAFFEAHFRQPCSGVSIISPAANWVIKKASSYDTTDLDETLPITFGDYDLTNPLFESITLQYRRIGSNTWNTIQKFTKTELQEYFTQNRLVFKDPRYIYFWNIQGNENIVDGDYEIRAMAFCGTGGITYSKNIAGKIDRTTIQIFGKAQPADGILSTGDEISVDFNKQVLCGLVTEKDFVFTNKATGDTIKMNTTCLGNKIIFTPLQSISALDGITVQAKLINITDVFENKLEKSIAWSFVISNNPLFILPKEINYSIYKGRKETVDLNILNTQNGSYSVAFSGLNLAQIKFPNTSANINPVGIKLPMEIDASIGNIGVYTDTFIATITSTTGYAPLKLPIKINVVPAPPNWVVNANKFENTASVICNYEIDSNGIFSEDTMDKIAVSILGEVRGFANIIKVGQFYRAYISVFGNAADAGQPLNFKIWNASTGIEYSAMPRDNMTFAHNAFYGTTPEPRILDVNIQRDSLRFIPLQKGWNWLAFNTIKSNNRIETYLQNLKQRKGAKLKTLTHQASWNDNSKQWVNLSNGIENINTNHGYMLYIPAADTLSISGTNAGKPQLSLNPGWNLIGNTVSQNTNINTTLTGTGLSHLSKIKGRLTSPVQIGDYDSATKTWNGINLLLPNQSYMLKNGKSATIQMRAGDTSCNFKPQEFELNTTFFAVINLDNTEMTSTSYAVKAMIDGNCVGYSNLEFNNQLKRYVMNLFVYGNEQGKTVQFRIVDEISGKSWSVPESVVFNSDKWYGTPEQPYIFSNIANANSIKTISLMKFTVNAFPMPVKSHYQLQITSPIASTSNFEILDMKGRRIDNKLLQLNTGKNTIAMKNTLSAGMYLIRVSIGNLEQTIKLVVE